MVAWGDTESLHIWNPDITNLAGSQELTTQAYILTATKMPQGILIFTSNDLWLMAYEGPPYAYGIVQQAASCGPISHRAPISIGPFCAWPSQQSFWAYSGNAFPLFCDVQDWFYSLVNRSMAGRVFGSPNPPFAELWWDWPDESSTECNRYLCVNYNPQSATMGGVYSTQRPWSIGMRTRTAGDFLGTMDNPVLGGPADGGGALYLHEYGWTDSGNQRAANGEIYAETAAISLGEGDTRFDVTQIVFDAATDPNTPAFGCRLIMKEQPFDTVETDTGLYTAIHNGLMDVRTSGRSARLRIEATADQPFGVGKLRLEVRKAGRR